MEQKICAKCKNAYNHFGMFFCDRPGVARNIVTGRAPTCDFERKGKCGKEGRFYEKGKPRAIQCWHAFPLHDTKGKATEVAITVIGLTWLVFALALIVRTCSGG